MHKPAALLAKPLLLCPVPTKGLKRSPEPQCTPMRLSGDARSHTVRAGRAKQSWGAQERPNLARQVRRRPARCRPVSARQPRKPELGGPARCWEIWGRTGRGVGQPGEASGRPFPRCTPGRAGVCVLGPGAHIGWGNQVTAVFGVREPSGVSPAGEPPGGRPDASRGPGWKGETTYPEPPNLLPPLATKVQWPAEREPPGLVRPGSWLAFAGRGTPRRVLGGRRRVETCGAGPRRRRRTARGGWHDARATETKLARVKVSAAAST